MNEFGLNYIDIVFTDLQRIGPVASFHSRTRKIKYANQMI